MELNTEEMLLVRCATLGGAGRSANVTEAISNGSISWKRVLRLAHWHRMSGVAFSCLKETAPADLVPGEVMEHLHDHYRYTAVRGLFIRSEFARAVNALQAKGIEVMALKGVVLLDTVYGDAGHREMSDIDVLVKSERAEEAQQIIQGFGYEPVGTEATQQYTRMNHRHLPRLHNHDRELSFEVHTQLISSGSPLQFDIETVWASARSAQISGVEVKVPSPEHMLLHLAVHFFLDRRFTSGSSLKQLNDVALLIQENDPEIDWELFMTEVERFRLSAPVFTVLSTAVALMDAGVPETVLERLRPVNYSRKMQDLFIRQRVLQTEILTATELVPHRSRYSLGAVLKGIVKRVSPSQEYMETHYGSEAISASGRTRLRRYGELAQRTFGYVRNPFRLWQEIQVDKWLHSLSAGGAPGSNKRQA